MPAVSGFEDLDRVFRELSKGMANRIARPGLAKAGRLAAKKVKASVPSRLKDIKKLVKSKSIKTKQNGGFAGVKIGPAVGQKKKKADQSSKKRKKPGVGISSANVHWFFTGTTDRVTGFKTRRRRKKTGGSEIVSRQLNGNIVRETGQMKQQLPGVSTTLAAAKTEMAAIIKTSVAENVEKEAARLAKKRL